LETALALLTAVGAGAKTGERMRLLVSGPGADGSSETWIGGFLARTRFFDEPGHASLRNPKNHQALVRVLERYLLDADVYQNSSDGLHPLVLVPRQGSTLFRLSPAEGLGTSGRRYAFMQVLMAFRWSPTGPPLARLT